MLMHVKITMVHGQKFMKIRSWVVIRTKPATNLASERIDGPTGSVEPVSLFDDSLSAPALIKTGKNFISSFTKTL